VASTHVPLTLSSKPSVQARQIAPVGSQSSQLEGQSAEAAAISSSARRTKYFIVL